MIGKLKAYFKDLKWWGNLNQVTGHKGWRRNQNTQRRANSSGPFNSVFLNRGNLLCGNQKPWRRNEFKKSGNSLWNKEEFQPEELRAIFA